MSKRIVVLSGAGISAESGLRTFRDAGGLWEGYDVRKVASIEGWYEDPQQVLEFYNMRRKQAADAEPNEAHYAIADLQDRYDVQVVTQNVDDLHERAGSEKVLHLHGRLSMARSTGDPSYVVDIGTRKIRWGDRCPLGFQLRPHIVWFGEDVPAIYEAMDLVAAADELLVVGTSLEVYPAAGLIHHVRHGGVISVVDPTLPSLSGGKGVRYYPFKATEGIQRWILDLQV